jgi:pimeloyl-ACP methyl ester carboxylesterase
VRAFGGEQASAALLSLFTLGNETRRSASFSYAVIGIGRTRRCPHDSDHPQPRDWTRASDMPPILLIPGNMCDERLWQPVAERLAAAGTPRAAFSSARPRLDRRDGGGGARRE